jgi:hypothetical protein
MPVVRPSFEEKSVMGATAGAAAAAAAIAQAVKASGVVVRLDPVEFAKVLNRIDKPLVVISQGGIFRANYQYLVSYKGLAFYTKADAALDLPNGAEVVTATTIWIPG